MERLSSFKRKSTASEKTKLISSGTATTAIASTTKKFTRFFKSSFEENNSISLSPKDSKSKAASTSISEKPKTATGTATSTAKSSIKPSLKSVLTSPSVSVSASASASASESFSSLSSTSLSKSKTKNKFKLKKSSEVMGGSSATPTLPQLTNLNAIEYNISENQQEKLGERKHQLCQQKTILPMQEDSSELKQTIINSKAILSPTNDVKTATINKKNIKTIDQQEKPNNLQQNPQQLQQEEQCQHQHRENNHQNQQNQQEQQIFENQSKLESSSDPFLSRQSQIENLIVKSEATKSPDLSANLKDKSIITTEVLISATKSTPITTTATISSSSTANATKPIKTSTSTGKNSKFAEKLRRSFRRSEHKSLEIKRTEEFGLTNGTTANSNNNNNQDSSSLMRRTLQLQKHTQSIFSLSNLPGLGGHINPALLLDSPDEATPPEYAYHHLSSVATTNSSTSLESNFEFCENLTSPTNSNSGCFWSWKQPQPSISSTTSASSGSNTTAKMGNEIGSASGNAESKNERRKLSEMNKMNKQAAKASLEAQNSVRNDQNLGVAASTSSQANIVSSTTAQLGVIGPSSSTGATSRSCSITSDSGSIRLSRLHNFLFKSSNESSRSYQGHSNEGFTASSHNSSSGEWENFAAFTTTNFATTADNYRGSFPEETGYEELPNQSPDPMSLSATTSNIFCNNNLPPRVSSVTAASSLATTTASSSYESNEAGSYYQYTLASPNNPFLPEITARTYHSPYDEKLNEEEEEFDSNITYVKYGDISSHTAILPTPCYSRAGSQESNQSEGAVSGISGTSAYSLSAHEPMPSPTSSNASTPGRQKRKLFSLHSPTKHLLQSTQSGPTPNVATNEQQQQQQQHLHHHHQCTGAHQKQTSSLSRRNLNPFLPITSSKRLPRKQTAVTSPTTPAQDLRAKREEFLAATMKICLVVSPPCNKLQLKSRSLTHLDGLDTNVNAAASAGKNTTNQNQKNKPPKSKATKPKVKENFRSYIQECVQPQPPQSNKLSPKTPLLCGICNNPVPTTSSASNLPVSGQTINTVSVAPSTSSCVKKKSSFMKRKKPLLTRSEVSSSEYFSITFANDQGCADSEFIAATKGVNLSTALSSSLKRRNLSFSQILITDHNPTPSHLDANVSSVLASLDENTETEHLAGRHLIITEKDGSRKILQKAASFGSRARPPRLLSSASTEDTNEASASGRQIKQRFSMLLGIKNPHQSQLCELLNDYAKNGVPQKKACLSFNHPDLDAAIEYLDHLHSSWRDFIDVNKVKEQDNRLQNAIWELVYTEVCYIQSLKTVTDLFLACLEAIQGENILAEIDSNRLFSNIRLIYEANLKFFTIYLYPMLSHSFATRNPLNWFFFRQGFISFPTIFEPYTKYCAEQSTCQFYCKELYRSNLLFKSYLTWCESQKMCNRLTLVDILVTPMQRLTKYSLLLGVIKKEMQHPDDYDALDKMIQSVEAFVLSVNNHLTARQENERLKGVMARIESYDVVETNNDNLDRLIKKHSLMFDLCAPMLGCPAHPERHLYMEGDHKFKDNVGKAEVHCFLLTDMLLICKPIAKKGLGSLKVIRQPFITDRLIVEQTQNVLNCVYLNEFNVAITAFTLQCAEATKWFEALKRAKTFYTKLKQSSNNWDNIRLAGSAASGGTIESLSVKKSPMNSSICSRVSSANNSHSGSVEWNDSRNISVDFEKTNSLSSEEGAAYMAHGYPLKGKHIHQVNPQRLAVATTTSSNTLSVQPGNGLGQSLPNLNLSQCHTNNTLLVPGTTTSNSGNLLLSPSHRGISYPPPSPSRVPLRRAMAFSTSTKNPPLLKTRNITSQSSIICHHVPASGTPQHSSNLDINSMKYNQTLSGSQASFSAIQQQQSNEMDSSQGLITTDNTSSTSQINESGDHQLSFKLSNSSLTNTESEPANPPPSPASASGQKPNQETFV